MSQYDRNDSHEHDNDHDAGARLQDQADRFSRKLSESAQQVWLAGLGAFGKAQAEGSKFFDSLVREGQTMEEKAHNDPERGEGLRETVENNLGQARERAAGTWDRVEKTFEDRVQRVLRSLQIPTRADVEELNARLDALNARLNRAENRANASPAVADNAAKDSPKA